MGQYHIPVNLDKKEYINPHRFGCGLKMYEISGSMAGHALLLLLCPSAGRGGGDIDGEDVAGRWAGDRIVLAGDYADPLEGSELNLYSTVTSDPEWKDISGECCDAMGVKKDPWL